ncbi:PREDICTED: coxsackievirus and adenovirus receptor-like isoform X2 [Branchiostoma belcheri]|uniref:Coxsackievirus and adenovirus receptor-like isoform X2 n=1 Tax=Branchiostoma belcheri TaxID=7741 RepID=A0A6P5A703_BRABE|nr:PREDICTED: coxsackievirus and adenovirus receptor-like isoform X2 [Branchiostoma belcheri]
MSSGFDKMFRTLRLSVVFAIASLSVGASESDIGLTLPSTVNTIAGDQVTLPATYTTRRRVMAITWHKMDAKTTERTLIYSYYPQEDARESFGPYIGRTNLVGKASLTISPTTPDDEGKYVVMILAKGAGSAEGVVKLSVMDPASIISISESVTAMVSDTVTIQCVADGDPTPNITWSKNGRRLRSQSSVMSRDVVVASVRVSKVRVNDSGTYLCKANNGVGGDSTKSLTLTIQQLKRRVPFSTLAVIVGATAGGLWLVVCVGFAIYCARRRKREKEKKKFAFYYNIGRRQPGVGDTTTEDDKEPPPYSAMPAKPDNKASSYGGINTIRKSIGRKDRRYARAMFAYRPREDNELPLETDDVIEVLEGEDGGWCLGYLRGRIGLFPSNYVKFVTTSEVLAMKSGATCQMVALQETVGSKRSI